MPHDLAVALPEQYVGAVPWNILPQGVYPHPHQNGPAAQPFPFFASTVVDLPLSAAALFVTAQGNGLAGVVNIRDDGQQGSSNVRVEVQMYHTRSHLAQSSQVWLERPNAGRNGIKIQTPHRLHRDERIFFNVEMHIPSSSSTSRQRIDSFETELPQFAHLIGDLSQSVYFDFLSLRSANSPIVSKSLLATTALLSTSNAAIDGCFICSDYLSLQTTNGMINADVSLSNDNRTSTVDMGTSNGRICSSISLISSTRDGSGAVYNVSAVSSNGPISISFPSAPLNSIQNVGLQTSNAPLSAQMHYTFEGAFSLQTSNGFPSIQRNAYAHDPAGTGRQRNVVYTQDRRGHITGTATWGDHVGRALGTMMLGTSNGAVTLLL